jgi:hypothetical protein
MNNSWKMKNYCQLFNNLNTYWSTISISIILFLYFQLFNSSYHESYGHDLNNEDLRHA